MDTNTQNTKAVLSVPVAILIAGCVIAAAIVYAFAFSPAAGSKTAATPESEVIPVPAVTDADHRLGAASPKLTIVEYSDLECPYCGDFHPAVKQVVAEFGNEVAWVYRHFPLTQIHPAALPAALAAECMATKKGNDAFWKFIDGIFADQPSMSAELFHRLAGESGVSAEELDACISSQEGLGLIQQQFNDAVAAGGKGTPFTAILNRKGEQVAVLPGTLTYAQLKMQIEGLLQAE